MTESSPGNVEVLHVGQDESLPEVLTRLRQVSGKTVQVHIPMHSPILLTATEYRTLRETADTAGVDLSLVTQDRLRQQLASMFQLAQEPEASGDSVEWRPEATALGSSRSFGTWKDQPSEPAGQYADTMDPNAGRRRRGGNVGSGALPPENGESGDGASFSYLDEQEARRRRIRRIGQAVASALVLVIIGLVAAWWFLPGVTVQISVYEADVESELIYSVAADDASVPSDSAFAVSAEEQDDEVAFTISIPATGVRTEGASTASGEVVLRNPGESAVTVPAGTELTSQAAETTYTTTDEAEVPAANDEPGETSVQVEADEAGSLGNLEQGVLTGQLEDLGVFYSNLETEIAGGDEIEIAVVTEEDIAELEERVEGDPTEDIAAGWERELPEGLAVVTTSLEAENIDYSIDQEAGEDAEEVTLQGTAGVSGLVYSLAEVEEQSRETFAEELQEQAPQGFILDPDSITLGDPEVIAEAPNIIDYQVSATGQTFARFDESAQEALIADLAGQSGEEAETTVDEQPAVESWSIEQSPGWWLDRMPASEDRITIEVSAAAEAEPAGTPEEGGSE